MKLWQYVWQGVRRPWLIFWAVVTLTVALGLIAEDVYIAWTPNGSQQWWTVPIMCAAVANGFLGTGAIVRLADQGLVPGWPLPVRHQAEPLRGYKLAKLIRVMEQPKNELVVNGTPCRGDEIVFAGAVGNGMPYRVDDTAHCYKALHEAADPDCSCGFYAMKKPSRVHPMLQGEDVILEVELFGRVICCESGYRAERQRVLSVTVARHCTFCGQEPAGVIAWRGTAFAAPLFPVCERDSAASEDGLMALSEVAGRLGTEVRWEPQRVP